jgi:hypothetical protein
MALEDREIFTPGAYPTHTYVTRSDADERALENALDVGGMIASVIGPSKTGKTVLVNKVVSRELLISLSGAQIDSATDLWRQASGKIGIPSLSDVEVIDYLIEGNYVLLIDDFHYVQRQAQKRIAQQLKDAVAKGLRVVVVAVPHRADDPIRVNPDLRGRVRMIDLDYWDLPELRKIAEAGFPLLNLQLGSGDIRELAVESLRSPQLMQSLCLELCSFFGVSRPEAEIRQITVSREALDGIARATSKMADCKTAYEILSTGPRERGRRRTQYRLRDGREGDVYTVILKALAADPPRLDFPYAEFKGRAGGILADGNEPPGGSLRQAIVQMDKLVRKRIPEDRVFEWDTERHVIDIPDPYFLFYLRWGVSPRDEPLSP